MLSDFEPRLRAFAEVIVRVGLNLQRGQRLLIAEPYELQGVARGAEVIVEALRRAASCDIEIIWGDGARLREFAVNKDWRGYVQLVGTNARRMQEYIRQQDALLFLQGSQPRLLDGVPADAVTELRRIGWEYFGPIAQQLVSGATNWTIAPAPGPAWAQVAYPDLLAEQRLAALWGDVFTAMRVNEPAPLTAWQVHLLSLKQRCDELNAQRLTGLHYQGEGTELSVALPLGHTWSTAQLVTAGGRPFVANLPTEEIFTAPHRDSAEGTVRVARPINHGGAVIDGIELEFRRGRIVAAQARTGGDLLRQLLATDVGASRLGEVALIPHETSLGRAARLFHHPLLDENAANHIALGEGYGFNLAAADRSSLNRSLIHVDLPVAAAVQLLPGN